MIKQIRRRRQREEFENEPELKKIAINQLNIAKEDYEVRAKEDKEYNQKLNEQRSSTFDVSPTNQQSLDVTVPLPASGGGEGGGGASVVEPLSFNTNVNSASRLASAFIPPVNVAAVDPSVMERGKQLFNRPGEITFASKGGIMNARKIMQRVI